MPTDIPLHQLPYPLLLLIHLHLLNYPHANQPGSEYDEYLFDSKRHGIKERTKAMQDVSAFLIGRLEGLKAIKSILPNYPPIKPSDTTAFRTSLAKYIETFRHRVLDQLKCDPGVTGGWWKDVVVRKSLLEECSGERFEYLILSLSTHALYIQARSPSPNPSLFDQAQAYASLLSHFRALKRAWNARADALTRRGEQIALVRANLLDPSRPPSQYAHLPTARLLSLEESRCRDLLLLAWSGEQRQRALDALIEIAGVRPTASQIPSSVNGEDPIDVDSFAKRPVGVSLNPEPLPIAAARHPALLRKLTAPILRTLTFKEPNGQELEPSRSDGNHDSDKENAVPRARLGVALVGKAEETRQLGVRLKTALDQARTTATSTGMGIRHEMRKEAPAVQWVDFDRAPQERTLTSYASTLAGVDGIEERIKAIRASLGVPKQPSAQAQGTLKSKLPARSSKPLSNVAVTPATTSKTSKAKGIISAAVKAKAKPVKKYEPDSEEERWLQREGDASLASVLLHAGRSMQLDELGQVDSELEDDARDMSEVLLDQSLTWG